MNKSYIHNLWKTWKDVIDKKNRSTVSTKFTVNDSLTTDKKSVANWFDNLFTNIGPFLASNIPSTNPSAANYIR